MSADRRKFALVIPDGLDARRFQWEYDVDFPAEPERHAEAAMLIAWLTGWAWLSDWPPTWLGLGVTSMPLTRARVVLESCEVLTL